MGRNPFSIKIWVVGEEGEVQKGICNYYFRNLLVENGFPSPVTKHIVCFLYMTFVILQSTVSHNVGICVSLIPFIL